MAENSGIEWTDHTFNPWIGCTKVSPACDNCYAETWDKRFGGEHWGPRAKRKLTSTANWKKPIQWNAKAEKEGTRFKVFCASLADVFDNKVPDEWRTALWELIKATPHLDWQLLTKRPQNIAKMLPDDWVTGYKNVWLGTTVENQEEANRRIPHLLRVPAQIRFLSCEPLLGPVKLWTFEDGDLYGPGVVYYGSHNGLYDDEKPEGYDDAQVEIDWIIIGGESGANARPMHPDWARQIIEQCTEAKVPVFFKQWGEWAPFVIFDQDTGKQMVNINPSKKSGIILMQEPCVNMKRFGKKKTGRTIAGKEYSQFPQTKGEPT